MMIEMLTREPRITAPIMNVQWCLQFNFTVKMCGQEYLVKNFWKKGGLTAHCA